MTRSNRYLPEGRLLDTPENREATASVTALMQAREDGTLLEARAVRCDAEHNLYVRFPFGEGIIPREEGAEGIAEGDTRDIALITRVNKPVCFVDVSKEKIGRMISNIPVVDSDSTGCRGRMSVV